MRHVRNAQIFYALPGTVNDINRIVSQYEIKERRRRPGPAVRNALRNLFNEFHLLFIDHQLNATPQDQLLMIKYLGVDAPYSPFYSGGLAALDSAANGRFGTGFADLEQRQGAELVGQIAQADPDGWSGPPAPFFYFVVRNDALDVVYGTKAGFERLDIPYRAHIEPPSRWGE